MRPVEKDAWPIQEIITALVSAGPIAPEVALAAAQGKITVSHVDLKLHVNTLEGTMTGNHWDYLVRGLKGEFYPVQKEIFEATYEAID
jgi:hypothetical protein